MANEQELQRLIQQAQQRQDTAKKVAEQEHQNKRLTLMANFQQALERDLSPELFKALAIQFEWVSSKNPIFGCLSRRTEVNRSYVASYSSDYDFYSYMQGRLPEFWLDTRETYVSTFMVRSNKLVVGRCYTYSVTLMGYTQTYTQSEPHSPHYIVCTASGNFITDFVPSYFRDGLLLNIDRWLRGDFST